MMKMTMMTMMMMMMMHIYDDTWRYQPIYTGLGDWVKAAVARLTGLTDILAMQRGRVFDLGPCSVWLENPGHGRTGFPPIYQFSFSYVLSWGLVRCL